MRWRRIYGNGKEESATPAVQVPSDVLHPELYDRLVWRNSEASGWGCPSIRLSNKSHLGISNLLPADKAMLVRILISERKE